MVRYQITGEMKVFVPYIDREHAVLVSIMNKLDETIKSQGNSEAQLELFDKCANYMVIHFSHEEEFMLEIGYPDYDEQLSSHNMFVSVMKEFRKLADSGKVTYEDILEFLDKWFFAHIAVMDRKIGTFLAEKHPSLTEIQHKFDLSRLGELLP